MIVLVDDEKDITDVLAYVFEAENKEVISFNNPLEAHDYILANKDLVKLVITDYSMPTMKGIELIKSLRLKGVECRFMLHSGIDDIGILVDLSDFEYSLGVKNKTLFIEKPCFDILAKCEMAGVGI